MNRLAKKRKFIKKNIRDYRDSKKCLICNINKNLTYHHLDKKDKSFGLGRTPLSLIKVKNEIYKCVVVCEKCHFNIHHSPTIQINNKLHNILSRRKQKLRDKYLTNCEKCYRWRHLNFIDPNNKVFTGLDEIKIQKCSVLCDRCYSS